MKMVELTSTNHTRWLHYESRSCNLRHI